MGLCSNQAVTFEIFSQEFEHGHIIGKNVLHFPSRSSVMNNIFQFINLSYGWLEKVYKDQFHLFSIFKQQMGLISFIVSFHYNFSPFDSLGVNRFECPIRVEEKTKNYLEWLNLESYCLLPLSTNSHTFCDPIRILMDEFLKSKFQPRHDVILDLSLNFKQQVRTVSILIYIASKPSLVCWVINCKERTIDHFSKWLHWIYHFI